jgi:hypothetical protein
MHRYHKPNDFDKEKHWHLSKKHENWEQHHFEDESSSSSSSSSDDDWDHHQHQEACVEEVLKAILYAQCKAKKHQDCHTSCCESFNELLGEKVKVKKNTIPFILYCGDCEPFKATGVTTYKSQKDKEKFACITSFIFKIKKVKDGCAVLELLVINPEKCHSTDQEKKYNCSEVHSLCCQINHKDVHDLVNTGICITVDLSCFCAITCLPPVCL